MALPVGGSIPWPPEDCQAHLADCEAWQAWWSGDPDQLMLTGHDASVRPYVEQRKFDMGTGQRRRFWGRRATQNDAMGATRPVHAPLAADIAATSADLLFGEPPDLVIEEPAPAPPRLSGPKPNPMTDPQGALAFDDQQATLEAAHAEAVEKQRSKDAQVQAAVEEIVDEVALWSKLLEGAETCAAVGGVYLRCVWDATVADHPLLQVIEHDRAVPDFKWGQLVAVTFWEVVLDQGGQVWRHLERHEDGMILHGLYQGSSTLLGDPVDLSQHPSTADLEPVVTLPPGMPRPLVVSYVPNVLPNRRNRRHPVGRADISGSETQLDALDEAWSSLMRDVRLGQARIVVPDEFLTPAGTRPGDGKTLDVDQELFTGLEIAELEKVSNLIQMIQPDIRVEPLTQLVLKLVGSIVSASGYSPQTFGLEIEGQAESGTALRIREKKTLHTLRRKRGYWTRAIADTVENLMALDQKLFGGPEPARPRVDWPDLADDPAERAQTTSLWHAAQAVSLWERVKARNPHWDERQIQAEVERIEKEKAAAMPVMELPMVDDDGNPVRPDDENGKPPTGRPPGTPE